MEEKIRQIIRDILIKEGKPIPQIINGDTNLRKDLEFDSLMLAVLTVMIEDDFGVDIFEDGIVSTFSDIIKKLENQEHK
jgi:acyl carrier protein